VIAWVALTFGVAFGSAILPLISIEVFVLGLATQQTGMSFWIVGAAVAAGQVLGKLLYFYAARGDLHLPKWLHLKKKERDPDKPPSRWSRWMTWIRDRCHRHPHWMFGTHAMSSVVGLPPFMATTVLAGFAGMSTTLFVATGAVGRFARFTLLAACPAIFAGWIG
jgi:membrane protein YqaA with SNARE-associated domain